MAFIVSDIEAVTQNFSNYVYWLLKNGYFIICDMKKWLLFDP